MEGDVKMDLKELRYEGVRLFDARDRWLVITTAMNLGFRNFLTIRDC